MPVTLSLRSMLVNGELAGVRPGMSRTEVRARLGEPDDWAVARRRGRRAQRQAEVDRSRLWRYGTLEVHFDGDSVVLLFTDHFEALGAGKVGPLDRWIFDGSVPLDLASVVGRLRDDRVEFEMRRDALGRPLLSTPGGGRLLFEGLEGTSERCVAVYVEQPHEGSRRGR